MNTTQKLIFDYRDYPIIPVRFRNNERKTPLIEALLDSGGDFIVIPFPIARFLDLKLEEAGDVDTAGGKTSLFKTEVDLAIGIEKCHTLYYQKEIHVSTREDIPVLLGRTPLFEDYEITFKKHKNKLILQPLSMKVYSSYASGF
ncbi:MAG: aspartyl protease [Candidatus Thermoplasmatota archaeon]|nr:aspartyl protease [Candidatus Thermoplasmatota archaeon]